MSTSEPGKNAPHSAGTTDFRTASVPGESQVVPAGFPDPAVLARMANEFFTAMPSTESLLPEAERSASVPGAAEAMGAARNPAAYVSLPATLPSAGIPSASIPPASLPTEAELRSLPAHIKRSAGCAVHPGYSGRDASRNSRRSERRRFRDDLLFRFPRRNSSAVFLSLGVAIARSALAPERHHPRRNRNARIRQQFLFHGHASSSGIDRGPLLAASSRERHATSRPANFFDYPFLDEVRPLAPVQSIPVRDDPFRLDKQALPGINLSSRSFEVEAIRRDFPILQERVNGKPLDLARQRRHHAKTAKRHRPPQLFLRARKLQHPPRRPRTGRPRHRCLRSRSRQRSAAS